MNIVLVNAFETYENRVNLIYEYLESKGHNISVLQSDFLHVKKTKISVQKDNITYIKVKPYKKNMSLKRLASHIQFSKNVLKVIEKIEPDLIYCLIPPNYLVQEISSYKKRNPDIKVIWDIIDLWPETFPVPLFKNNIFFKKWQKIRDMNLFSADEIILECDYFRQHLPKDIIKRNPKSLYMSRKDKNVTSAYVFNSESLHICYLGSINNLIDIEKIQQIISNIIKTRNVVLHIIGDGEKRDKFISSIEETGAEVIFHGKVYSAVEKQRIFDMCHFGLNIMKPSVTVGLTMKSVDYFEGGVPIINNIPGDTAEMISKYNAGINMSTKNNEASIKFICNMNEKNMKTLRKNAAKIYYNELSEEAFYKRLESILEKHL